MWHFKLGHPNTHAVKLVLHDCNIPFKNKDSTSFCLDCCMGKAHKLHATASQTTYSHLLELIDGHLWGPSPNTSILGFNTICPL